jgi:hypothetical protein
MVVLDGWSGGGESDEPVERGLELGELKCGSALSGGRDGGSFVFGFVGEFVLLGEVVSEGMERSGVGIGFNWGESEVRGGRVVELPKFSSSEFGRLFRSRKYKNRSVSSFLISPFLMGPFSASFSPLLSSAEVEERKSVGLVFCVVVDGVVIAIVVVVVFGEWLSSLKLLECEEVEVVALFVMVGESGALSSSFSCMANQKCIGPL